MTTTLGTSNLRGSAPSRLTRTNPARASKGLGSASMRQNSLVSNSGLPLASSSATMALNNPTPNDPPGLYPGITQFSDAIAALPREYRRHTSLLKEVDAKAWQPEENLQKMLDHILADTAVSTRDSAIPAQNLTGSATAEDPLNVSDANSVAGASIDNASLASVHSADPAIMQRRQNFHALRQNLMAIMVTMDEKNHVINNANEELDRHNHRLDSIFRHAAKEVSEEARLGSLKHWAYTETNPVKKPTAPTTRREAAAASLATLHESEVAHRSESRREALMARRQRVTQPVDSDFDESRLPARKATANGKKRAAEALPEPAALGISGAGTGKRKKPEKSAIGGITMERSISSALGGRPMSRENSQQENAKKRKASTAATAVARKRLNATTQDSPKLASSPLAGTAGKEAYKRSPALSTVRPAVGRGRQNSTHAVESSRARPSSLTSNRNGNNHVVTANTPELNSVAAPTGKSANEVKNTMKETKVNKGDRLSEEDPRTVNGADGDHPLRGAILLERSSSRQDIAKGESLGDVSTKGVASPHLPALQTSDLRNERPARGRASKAATPIVGTFAEAESTDTASANGNGNKSKRPARPRARDQGLHDSLSPKGLPMKRSHKKGASLSAFPPAMATTSTQRLKDENDMSRTKSTTPSEKGLGITTIHNAINTANDTPDGEDDSNDPAEADAEEDEERYCYCEGVSYGEMVACDKEDCPRQWFHLECIGLKSVPKSAKWYCDECKEVLARKGKGSAGGGSNGGGGNGGGSERERK